MKGGPNSIGQLRRCVETFLGAADLLKEQYPGQAAARAHYAVYAATDYIGRLYGPPVWDTDPSTGKWQNRLHHTRVPDIVSAVCEFQIARGQVVIPHLTPNAAYSKADNLLKARMDGDYRPHRAFSKEVAAQLIMSAYTLTKMLIAEAEFVENARKQGQAPQKGTAS